MANQAYNGFETNDATGMNALSGTASIVTSPVRTGTYALRTNPTTTGTGNGHIVSQELSAFGFTSGFNEVNHRIEFQFRADLLPSANSEPFVQCANSSSALKLEVRIGSDGKLSAYDNTGTNLLATGTTVLSTGVWYRIGVLCGTGASANWEVQINGVTEISGTGDLLTSNCDRWFLGKRTNRNGESVDFFFDDVVADDAAFPGNVEIKLAKPTGDGSTMQWTNGSGGAGTGNYEEVDEIPPDDADYVTSTGGAGEVALFAMQDTATLGITGTIHGILAMTRMREDAGATTATAVRVRSGSTNSDSSNVDHTTTATYRGRLLTVDPDTGVAWTLAGVDAVEIGAIENNAVATRLTTVLMMVAYTPSAVVAARPSFRTNALRPNIFVPGMAR